MWRKLLYKWFGLIDDPCETCEILREQLHKSEVERKELLIRLLDKDEPEPPPIEEESVPIQPQFIPWRIKQQMLEAEDRKKAQLMRDKSNEIQESRKVRVSELEKELGVATDESAPSGGVKFK